MHPPWYRHLLNDWQNVLLFWIILALMISACSKLKSEIFYFENPIPIFFIAFNLSFNAWMVGANFRPFVQTLNSSLSPQ
jgi:hypothetical protein